MDFKFKEWIDVFGFDKEIEAAKKAPRAEDELPVKQLSISRLSELLCKNTVNGKPAYQKFVTEIYWGNNPGAVRVIVTPKLNIKIQRLHYNLQGEAVWTMKKYFFLNDREFGGKEDVVANEIFDHVKEVSEQQLDAGNSYKLEDLVYALVGALRQQDYEILNYEGTKKISENEYDLYFSLRGGGVGKLFGPKGQRPVNSLIVNTSFNEQSGMIKIFAEMVTGHDDNTAWEIQPAEFEEYYLPTQSKKEIIGSVLTALKWY